MAHNPFWQYSLTIYQRPAVADLCLTLQDDFEADVNMLLCAAWLSSIGQPLTHSLLHELSRESCDWQKNCLTPLRQARRFLKQKAPADIYQKLKCAEVEAESMQQQKLYQRLKHLPLEADDDELLPHNVQLYLLALGKGGQKTILALSDALCQAIQDDTNTLSTVVD